MYNDTESYYSTYKAVWNRLGNKFKYRIDHVRSSGINHQCNIQIINKIMLYCGTLSVWFEFRYYTVRSRPAFVLHDHVFLGVLTHQDASYFLSWACFIFLILGMCLTPVLTDLSMRSGMYYFLCNISYVVLNGSWLNWWICEYTIFFICH